MKLDTIDLKILNILQLNAVEPIQSIADQVGLTNNPCWRRIKRLEDKGVITGRSIKINHRVIGLETTAFVSIRIESHNEAWLNRFQRCINDIPEIIECYRMAGDVDYLLKVLIVDLSHYDRVYRQLVANIPGLIDVSAAFSMEEIKIGNVIDVATGNIEV